MVLIIQHVALTFEPVDEILWQMKHLQQHSPRPGGAGSGHSVVNTHL